MTTASLIKTLQALVKMKPWRRRQALPRVAEALNREQQGEARTIPLKRVKDTVCKRCGTVLTKPDTDWSIPAYQRHPKYRGLVKPGLAVDMSESESEERYQPPSHDPSSDETIQTRYLHNLKP